MSRWLTFLKVELTRRKLLRGGALLVAGTAAGCGANYPPPPAPDAGPPDAGSDGGSNGAIFTVAASQIPVGGGTVFTDARFADPNCDCAANYDEFIVLQPVAGTFVALSTGCTHQFCSVRLNADNTLLVCPCHGSQYNLDGSVILGSGPATRSLYNLPVSSDGTTVSVTLS